MTTSEKEVTAAQQSRSSVIRLTTVGSERSGPSCGSKDKVESGVSNRASLRVGDACIRVGRSMKYLGLTLDTYWRFTQHFRVLGPRLERQVCAFARTMRAPNLGGPHEAVRRLYVTVVRSMALYGAPVWAGHLEDCRVGRELLATVNRRAVLRAVRAYRTVSHANLSALGGSPPFHLLAMKVAGGLLRLPQSPWSEEPPCAGWT